MLQFNRMIDVCAKANDVAGAERIFNRMVKDHVRINDFTIMLTIVASARAREARRAECWLHRAALAGLSLSAAAHVAVVDGYVRAGDGEAAALAFDRMLEAGFQLDARSYSPLLQAALQPGGGGSQRAAELLQQMQARSIQPDIVNYTDVLATQAAEGDWQLVYATLAAMAREGVAASAPTYSVLVNACANEPDAAGLERAEALLLRATGEGVEPTARLMNGMLKVCAKVGSSDRAQHWFGKMRLKYGVSPDAVSYNIMLGLYAKAGDIASAEDLLKKMGRSGHGADNISFNALIRACAKAKEPEQAERWLLRMDRQRLEPDLASFNATLQACEQGDDLARLWRVRELMQASGTRPDAVTFLSLALPYARRGDVERVEALMAESRAAGIRPQAREYSCLLSAYARAWPVPLQKAEEVFREMVAGGVKPTQQALNFLQLALGRSRAMALAEELGTTSPREQPPRRGGTRRGDSVGRSAR